MELFETVKACVSVPEAAERYGIRADGHGMAKCPFHDDRRPSLKLNPEFYYCFGCGASGDVTDLVSGLYGLSPYEAAKKIAMDFGIGPEGPPGGKAVIKARHPVIRAFREDERYCSRVLCDYLHLLEDWKERYAPVSMEEEPDDRYVEACLMHDVTEGLLDILTVGDLETRMEAVKELMKDGKIISLEERVRTTREEEGRSRDGEGPSED